MDMNMRRNNFSSKKKVVLTEICAFLLYGLWKYHPHKVRALIFTSYTMVYKSICSNCQIKKIVRKKCEKKFRPKLLYKMREGYQDLILQRRIHNPAKHLSRNFERK